MANYLYARGGQQIGPVSEIQLRDLIARGEVSPGDLAWTEGMPQWVPINAIPELAGGGSSTIPLAIAAPSGGVADYYRPRADIPGWAQLTLRGHALPRGDSATWPIDEMGAQIFSETLKLRKKVTSAANLYKGLGALTCIAVVFVGIGFLVMAFGGPGGGPRGIGTAVMGFLSVFLIAIIVLYFIAFRATFQSRRWAPLTMMILFLCSALLNLVSTAMLIASGGSQVPPAIAGQLVSLLLAAIFAFISGRAFAAIPRYLAQPAWCQELLVRAKL